MPSVQIRVEKVDDAELNAKKQGEETIAKDKGENEKLAVASIFAHQAISTTKQVINAGVSAIGSFSGDYLLQDRVEQVVDTTTQLVAVGITMAKNPVLGVALLGGMVVKDVVNAVVDEQNRKHQDKRDAFLLERSGNSLNNGSRTGD